MADWDVEEAQRQQDAAERVKEGMVRRMNVMHAALRAIEWNADGKCAGCGGDKRWGHGPAKHTPLDGSYRDSYEQPCPVAFALSEAAYAEPSNDAEPAGEPHADGSRHMRLKTWAPGRRRPSIQQGVSDD